ncbi:GNAT family N-acetyltransferase [Vibrio sp. DW001]|uniref:GNAT family N-acetyltransferase n=1 Tax=Vibrio sp. DW001 TaxID=2912315 RepID=UPI0023B14F25|nr:GNAT family N-acetyltransferase [Vibrio sp. DW001]WED28587.1 GNAT family N-acetyltransferase [Vibrio sp. DW001]
MNKKEIIVRHSEAKDAQGITQVYQCENAYSNTLQLPFPDGAVWESRIANKPDNIYSFVAEIDGEIVGNLGFEVFANLRRRHAGSFGMGVKDEQQGKGIGSALLSTMIELADNWLNLKRLELTVFIDNASAIALYKKFGFVIEGESEDYAFRKGEFVSVYHMARIKT